MEITKIYVQVKIPTPQNINISHFSATEVQGAFIDFFEKHPQIVGQVFESLENKETRTLSAKTYKEQCFIDFLKKRKSCKLKGNMTSTQLLREMRDNDFKEL